MLTLNLIEHPQEQTIDHEKAQIIHVSLFTPQPLMAVGVLFSPMVSG